MILDVIAKGTTNYSAMIRIVDASDGTPEEGVVYDTTGLILWYRRAGGTHSDMTSTTSPATLVTQTESGAHTDYGFVHIDDGYYRLDLPDAAVASGVDYVDIGGVVATGSPLSTTMVVIGGRIRLTDVDLDDATRGGMTAMPNANAGANGGLPTVNASNYVAGIAGTVNTFDGISNASGHVTLADGAHGGSSFVLTFDRLTGTSTSGDCVSLTGEGIGSGLAATGGATNGHGIIGSGGGTLGIGIYGYGASNGVGMRAYGRGANGYGFEMAGAVTNSLRVTSPTSASPIHVDTAATYPAMTLDTVGGSMPAIADESGNAITVGLVDNSITSGVYDESTAFPLAAADTGATYLARTGSNSPIDSLETIANQISSMNTTVGNIDTGVNNIEAKLPSKDYLAGSTDADGGVDATEATVIADALLARDMGAVTGEASRSMLNALRFLRNKWSISGSTLTVTEENDTTTAWTATITTDAGADPVTASDPT